MHFWKRAIYPLILVSAILSAAPIVLADQPKFESGELLVGYQKSSDRDRAVSAMEGIKDVVRVRGAKLEDVRAEVVSDKAVKLWLKFPDKVLNVMHSDPAQELGLLEDVARQLKLNDGTIVYAHPNWIASTR